MNTTTTETTTVPTLTPEYLAAQKLARAEARATKAAKREALHNRRQALAVEQKTILATGSDGSEFLAMLLPQIDELARKYIFDLKVARSSRSYLSLDLTSAKAQAFFNGERLKRKLREAIAPGGGISDADRRARLAAIEVELFGIDRDLSLIGF